MRRKSAVQSEPRVAAPAPEESLSVGQLMSKARASLLAALDAQLERSGVNAMQFAVLKQLSDGAARTAADLCRLMHHDTGAMTRLVDRLEERGLVRRERCRADRRVVFLRVAAAGRALLPRLREVGRRVLEAHLAGFSPAEIEALRDYLGRMIENGQTRGHNLQSRTGH
jgi:DNA-binding MarR family transcriptional regulator